MDMSQDLINLYGPWKHVYGPLKVKVDLQK